METSNINAIYQDEFINLDILKAVIVSVNTGNDELFYYQLEELKNLCAASAIEVVDEVVQNMSSISPVTYVGSGKLKEINTSALTNDADLVIFNDELSPVQLKNIAEELDSDLKVIDRTMVILDIFEHRARTKEASLQVEIARLKYERTRLIGKRSYLSRTTGGGAGGTGARRGSGETKLELDRRVIDKQIERAKGELASITKARLTSRKQRSSNSVPTVSFVGYTNAGKSSTINALMNQYKNGDDVKNVFVKNMLFATLETSTRNVKLPNNHEFLITDTVGFVSKLPHHLVESFKSTLEEITESALIVHIIDASSPFMDLQIETTNTVLAELAVDNIPTIYVFNKIDLVKEPRFVTSKYSDAIMISAVTLDGYNELVKKIDESLFPNLYEDELLIPFTNGEVYTNLKNKAEVLATEYLNEGIYVKVRLSEHLHNLYQQYLKK